MSNAGFSLEQLDEWETAMSQSKGIIASGDSSFQTAEEQRQKRLPEKATAQYQTALTHYEQALRILRPLTELGHEHNAIKLLRTEAQEAYAKINSQVQLLRTQQLIEQQQTNATRARELISNAQAALGQGQIEDAREQANQAKELDQSLTLPAEDILRLSRDLEAEGGNRSSLIVLGLFVIGIVALAVIFGPMVWGWISEFLFPPA